jgi:IMP dehydrogenase
MKINKAYDFDDIGIIPIPSKVSSRDDVNISVELSSFARLEFPLIVSPMVGVVDGAFAHALAGLGGMAILHRNYESRNALITDILANISSFDNYGVSVKVGEERFEEFFDYTPTVILVDTANGYTKAVLDYVYKITSYIYKNDIKCLVMAGNVVTSSGCNMLTDVGCNMIRVGIGGGSVCSTRNVTGIAVPNISALIETRSNMDSDKALLVIDGGIKNSGDFVKSIVAGAHLGMSGKLFAECYEAPNDGVLYGMASRTHMEKRGINIKSVEGFDIPITKKQSLETFVREFGFGIKSAGTMLDARTLNDMRINGYFNEVSSTAIKKF